MRTVVSVEKYTTRVSKQHYWTEGSLKQWFKLFGFTIL